MEISSLLPGLPENAASVDDPGGVGTFLRFTADAPAARHTFRLGPVSGIVRWTCQHRYEPFWMTAKCGTNLADVPPETQFWLGEREDGTCVLVVPLVDGIFRTAVQGTAENGLELVAETGDLATVGRTLTGAFVAEGPDPFELVKQSAKSVAKHLGIPRRHEKKTPKFADQFGWCTWDAFYQDVSHETVREGLASFARGGVTPKYLILDDGWQSVSEPTATGEKRLTAFAANAKFPGDLGPTVQMAKTEFGIETFLVWHAMGGYWGGVNDDKLPGYGVRSVARQYSPGITHFVPELVNWFGRACGVVPPERIYRFFQDYHRHLRAQGVDGVKVDNQAALEGLAAGVGGRVALMRAYREALEGSVAVHFGGNLINCMSCANEMLYGARASNLTRTSTDFWPDKPESHGQHVYVNAQVSLWFGEFVHPDWDMFQSAHPAGPFHAAARALSGGPVYVSDKPGTHNFDLLKKLVTPMGYILPASAPGVPTHDCLFHDPTREDVLLKIWNRNPSVLDMGGSVYSSAVIGAFHCRHDSETPHPISGAISPADISSFGVGRVNGNPRCYIVYAHNADELRVLTHEETWPLTLNPLEWEIWTISPMKSRVSAVGLTNYLNGGRAITRARREIQRGVFRFDLSSGGNFVAWCETAPTRVLGENDEVLKFTYDEASGRLDVDVPGEFPTLIGIFLREEGAAQ